MTDLQGFPIAVNKTDLARLLSIDPKTVDALVKEGVWVKTGNGKATRYPVIENIRNYVEREKGLVMRQSKGQTPKDVDAVERKALADAKMKELQLAKMEEKMIEIETADRLLDKVLSTVRLQLSSIPGNWTSQLLGFQVAAELSMVLQRLVDDLMAMTMNATIETIDEFDDEELETETEQIAE